MKKTIIIGVGVIALVIGAWLLYFKPSQPHTEFAFSASKAKRDIENGEVKLISFGIVGPDKATEFISLKYGFREYNLGCIVSHEKGLEDYQSIVGDYLKKRNGPDWRVRYDHEIDSFWKSQKKPGN